MRGSACWERWCSWKHTEGVVPTQTDRSYDAANEKDQVAGGFALPSVSLIAHAPPRPPQWIR